MIKQATFGAGCFWGVQAKFDALHGVTNTIVGYAGGTKKQPSYEEVCTGTTGHAEAITLKYDDNLISYDELLEVFWNMHNPTLLNRQGPDIGTQYRSIIFYHCDEQRQMAEHSRDSLEQARKWEQPIVTQIVPATTFYEAEAYHQHYFKQRGLDSFHACKIG
jgi:peptide-methionine (S)-S-oxide reductase